MNLNGKISDLSTELRLLIGAFIIVLSVGFISGLLFVRENSSTYPDGIEQQYLGNENDNEVEIMKFKKSDREMLSLVHSHVLSMSMIFFLTGLILSLTKLNRPLKIFLMIEPFFTIMLTFGGIYFLWEGLTWMKYVVLFSGTLMTLTFVLTVLIILNQLIRK